MEAPTKTQHPVTVRVFNHQYPANPRGARLARRVGLHKLHTWGIAYLSDASESAALLIGELAANAVTHGRVPGRNFELRLTYVPGDPEMPGLLRIEVSDTRGERRPPGPGELAVPEDGSDGGRGLLIVEALADRWAVLDRDPGKTVRAELDLPR
ncbi:ATP-binding protein [Streptomyces sp. V2I9]|uniref:ATP-binding protein n=1 Tax=Streptomyces sp. V2I9 TaxID=3042304 RepID=UPI00277F082D|nr:ATP-binding protein [Streptomyces sp. V2I9]MDQ0987777.1 anti-sigma regulatory factor (Ser/Thr protein kinase) [Streptomyces sp. V2I9]